ncbi:hypothetical protein OPT61_g8966 [Boeremia exigua]|uniref:Uncharacterized protein n=1 Tax=Boeremia exigua TaxID=749465 RepID=A0ACC2HXQ3_9PLEO|nr:hypothetical protein OPT61_g8966 [Boeremia exigua]
MTTTARCFLSALPTTPAASNPSDADSCAVRRIAAGLHSSRAARHVRAQRITRAHHLLRKPARRPRQPRRTAAEHVGAHGVHKGPPAPVCLLLVCQRVEVHGRCRTGMQGPETPPGVVESVQSRDGGVDDA